ncbi:pyrimidine nucleotide-sugar transmembrane transporter [Aureococcus anophagefferens]|nr:pyrimidine nucleotide-sugar transmembrane transporter [Aureococcus anophagefferens]
MGDARSRAQSTCNVSVDAFDVGASVSPSAGAASFVRIGCFCVDDEVETPKQKRGMKDKPDDASASGYMSPTNMGFICAALFFNTMSAPMVKLTQNAEGGRAAPRPRASADAPPTRAPQNNLGFLALQHMNSSAFQLLMNTRIVSVAVMSVVVLKKPMHAEWCSIVLLMVGAMQYQLSGCDDSGYRIDVEGLSVMAVIVFCAAAGNVYTQRVMQRKMDQPLMVQNAMLYVWGVLFNGVNWFASVVPRPEHHGPPVPLFGAIGAVEVLSMVFAAYGLSISIILKRFGAITRTFINTVAICCTAMIDVAFFGATVTVMELTTFAIIFIAVFCHSALSGVRPARRTT